MPPLRSKGLVKGREMIAIMRERGLVIQNGSAEMTCGLDPPPLPQHGSLAPIGLSKANQNINMKAHKSNMKGERQIGLKSERGTILRWLNTQSSKSNMVILKQSAISDTQQSATEEG